MDKLDHIGKSLDNRNYRLTDKRINKIDIEDFEDLAFLLHLWEGKEQFRGVSKRSPNEFGFQKLCFPVSVAEPDKEDEGIESKFKKKDKKTKTIDSKVKEVKPKRPNIPQKAYAQPQRDSYEKHSQMYNQFMKSIIYGKGYDDKEEDTPSYSMEKKRDGLRQGDEVMSHKERKEYIKNIMLNAKYKKELDYVSQDDKKRYEFWKMTDALNLFLSFVMYNHAFLYQ